MALEQTYSGATIEVDARKSTTGEQKSGGRAITRALDLLTCFTIDQPERRVAELARELRLSKSTVHRLLATLKSRGFVQQDETSEKYRLGIRLFELGAVVASRMNYLALARPYLKKLAQETGETVFLATLDQGQILYLDVVDSHQDMKFTPKIGMRRSPLFGSTGQVLLAWLPEEKLSQYIPNERFNVDAYDPILDPQQFRRVLAEVRELGYAFDPGRYVKDVAGICAPIKDHRGRVLAALVVAGPCVRFDGSTVRRLSKLVLKETAQISRELGYSDRSAAARRSG